MSLRYNLYEIKFKAKHITYTLEQKSFKLSSGKRILFSELLKIKRASTQLESISLYSYCKEQDYNFIKTQLSLKLKEIIEFRQDKFNRLSKAYKKFQTMIGTIFWINPTTRQKEQHPKAHIIEDIIADFHGITTEKSNVQIGETLTYATDTTSESWKIVDIEKVRFNTGANIINYTVE